MTYAHHVLVKCCRTSCPANQPTVEVALVPEHVDEERRRCWHCKKPSLRIVECEPPDLGVEL